MGRLRQLVTESRFGLLFWLLVAVLAAPILVPDGPLVRRVMVIALIILMLSGLSAISERRGQMIVGLCLAVPAAALGVIGVGSGDHELYVASQFFYLVFFVHLAFHILRWTLRQHEVDSETIYGAVGVYLLMALVWGLAYYMVVVTSPGSFHFPEHDDLGRIQTLRAEAVESGRTPTFSGDWREVSSHTQGTMMYYSFVTLTTLGYGDIYPASDVTRILAMLEATLGQLYLVILVARLVGLYTAQETERRRRTAA